MLNLVAENYGFPNVIKTFNSDDPFQDVEFVIPGMKQSYNLQRSTLARTSLMLESLFKGENCSHCKYNTETHRAEWLCEGTKTDDICCLVLVKWLRFCYGEDQTFAADECPAAIAVLYQLQLCCQNELKNDILQFMAEEAKKNALTGAGMLHDCVVVCATTNLFFEELASIVLTHENMKNHTTAVVGCLMDLPKEYLDLVQYSEGHDDLSEFSIRLKYLKYHDKSLSDVEKKNIIRSCNLGKLNSDELHELYMLGMFSDYSFVVKCHEETIAERDKYLSRVDEMGSKVEECMLVVKMVLREKEKEYRKKKCKFPFYAVIVYMVAQEHIGGFDELLNRQSFEERRRVFESEA